MKVSRRGFLGGGMGLALAGSAPAVLAAVTKNGPTTAFVGVDVLPMAGAERLLDQTVLVSGDRILRLGARRALRPPAGAWIVSGSGLTLMPGLVDMHVHLAPVPGQSGDAAQRAMAVMLAHGVTTARSMAGSPNNLLVRAAVEQGSLAGPRLYVAAPALNVNTVSSPDAARAAVRAAAEGGYDLLKAHHIEDVATWTALQEEAKARRLATAGHVTNPIGLERAMAAGQQIEHLDGVLFALLDPAGPERAIPFAQIPPPEVVEAAARRADTALPGLVRRMRETRSFHVPTLALFEKIVDPAADPRALRARPEMRFVPQAALDAWEMQRQQFADQAGYTPAASAAFRDLRRRVVAAMAEAGVPVMAGSDTAQNFHLWGPGLIEEVEALAAAGLTPMDALRSATSVPRDYLGTLPRAGSALGWQADFGTVEPGKRADLLVVEGDPSRDLSALRRIHTVVAGGRLYDRAALEAMLDRAAADARAA